MWLLIIASVADAFMCCGTDIYLELCPLLAEVLRDADHVAPKDGDRLHLEVYHCHAAAGRVRLDLKPPFRCHQVLAAD